jgi:hypothetical protein
LSTSPQRRQLPQPERLVNLTPHEIALEAIEPPADFDDSESPNLLTVRLPPEGQFARIDDNASRLSAGWLNAETSLIALTRMRRSTKLSDLPPPAPGTRLIVSRLTALAARNRGDLVFPYGELRDQAGRIIGMKGLAAFRRKLAPTQRYRDWRAAVRADLAGKVVGQEWLTGLLFAAATALLSGFLALCPGALDNASQHGWAGGGLAWTSWSSVFCFVTGVTLMSFATWRWRRRGQILTERGTAYVIDEVAIPWQHEEKESVLAEIRKGFARTLLVPGPNALDEAWQWQVDSESAARWDENVDGLVRSFWAVHYNDDQVTKNALFTWAPWPVAVAFGARATARRRGLALHVRQRTSHGAGANARLQVTDPAYDFQRGQHLEPLSDLTPDHAVQELYGQLTLNFEPLTSTHRREPAGHGRQVLLLIIRTTHGHIGDISMDLTQADPVAVHVPGLLADPVLPNGPHPVPVAEWRLTSATKPTPELPWKAFPSAAEEIADWIITQHRKHPGHLVLIAARIPQELAIGLGIQLGQRQNWPRQAYPVYYANRRLVVTDLLLGSESVPLERS